MGFFGLNISYLIKVKNKSRNEVAKLLGLSVSSIGAYINRGSLPTKEEDFIKIADYFGVTVDALFRVDMEKEGIPVQNIHSEKAETIQEQVVEYKSIIKELRQDKKVLQKAINALTDLKKDAACLPLSGKPAKV